MHACFSECTACDFPASLGPLIWMWIIGHGCHGLRGRSQTYVSDIIGMGSGEGRKTPPFRVGSSHLSSSNPHPVKVPAALFPSTTPLYIDFNLIVLILHVAR